MLGTPLTNEGERETERESERERARERERGRARQTDQQTEPNRFPFVHHGTRGLELPAYSNQRHD